MATNWDKIVSDKELNAVKRKRSKNYIEKKERRSTLGELVEEGWTKIKDYKDDRFIGVKKDKPLDEIFEDEVWMIFADMGFSYMNQDRYFKMCYDYQNSNITQQIDVFAADDETVLIIECKSAEKPKDGVFKKQIESFYAQIKGLTREAKRKFPRHNVRFIWATNNYIMNKADLEKLKEWGIVYFNETTIKYYKELVKHLGSSAKYQLLGNLFAKTEIKNMNNKIPAIQGNMGGFSYYSFSIEPEKLLKIGYVLHRNEINSDIMPTYQRLIKKSRLIEIRDFINNSGYFPNSIIISIDTNGRSLRFDQSATRVEGVNSKLGILYLPNKYHSAYIIDGQHRLYGYADTLYAESNTIPVIAFVDLGRDEQLKLFMDINEKQKAVPKSLRVTLLSDMNWDSDDYNERRQALRSKIAQMLESTATSPLLNRIRIGEDEETIFKCITIEALQAALKKCHFFSQFGKKNILISEGTFDLGDIQQTCDKFYPFLEECLIYTKTNLSSEWDLGKSGILTINRGIQGLIRIIDDIVIMLSEQNIINPKIDRNDDIIKEVKYYLDPFISFIENISEEEREELKGNLGGGADNKFWRIFQRSISDVREDFNPEGLDKYWLDKSKTFNDNSLQMLREIEIKLKDILQYFLELRYGQKWIISGIPKSVYTRATLEAADVNFERVQNDDKGEEISVWECVNMAECKEIVTYGKHWSELFKDIVTRPTERKLTGGQDAKTDWMLKLNTFNNKLKKASYSASSEEFNFIKEIYDWIIEIEIDDTILESLFDVAISEVTPDI